MLVDKAMKDKLPNEVMKKTIWIVNHYGSTPETSMGGRHFYLARELVALGYKVYLIAASFTHLLQKPPEVTQKIEIQSVDGINVVYIRLSKYKHAHSKKRIINEFIFSWRLGRFYSVIPDKPDTILCSSPSLLSFLGAEYVSRRVNAELIFEVRDIWPLTLIEIGGYSQKHPFVRLLQWIECRAYAKSKKVVSNLPYAVKHMLQHGLDPQKFTWISNGFCAYEFNSGKGLSEEFLKKIPKEKFIIGYTGTLGRANALDVLLDSAELLLDRTDIVFLIVGSGKEVSVLTEEIKRRGLINVVYMGAVEKRQINAVLQQFDVCFAAFHKSSLYQFGTSLNKLPEYLASETPVVYSVDSPYQPVKDANAGISVPAEDPQAISQAILELLALGEKGRKELGKNGRKYALEFHDYRVLAKRLVEVFNS